MVFICGRKEEEKDLPNLRTKINERKKLLWIHDGRIREADALISGITRNYPNTIKPGFRSDRKKR